VIGLAQRVLEARVMVDGQMIGQIQKGLLLLLCAEQGDTAANADKMLSKLLKMRIFGDEEGKMNRSLQDMDGNGLQGGLLVVSQFTLAADLSSGNRPSFKRAASPADGLRLYEYFVAQAREAHPIVQTGQFAADMKVHLINDGPVTIPLQM
jgi:D-tyrosyl-tRNA(Tyr) deacylase